MRIDVWSDLVCPWCYLGRRRLTLALSQIDFADDVEVRWRAYQLDPTATSVAKDLRAAIDAKYGPRGFEAMVARLGPLGAAVGIDYRFDLAQRVTSLPALGLLAWAEEHAGAPAADLLHEGLLRAYFTEGANIADPEVLVDRAVAAGLDGTAAGDALDRDLGRSIVDADLAEARDRELMGVPAFVLEGGLVIPGAQDVDTLVNLISRVHRRLQERQQD